MIQYIALILVIAFILYFVNTYFKMMKSSKISDNDQIVHLDEKNFVKETKNSVVLIDFWAGWCMPCKMMTPILNEIAEETKGKAKICKVNVEAQSGIASQFSVQSIPTLVLLKNGKEINRFVGIKPKEFLLNEIDKVL